MAEPSRLAGVHGSGVPPWSTSPGGRGRAAHRVPRRQRRPDGRRGVRRASPPGHPDARLPAGRARPAVAQQFHRHDRRRGPEHLRPPPGPRRRLRGRPLRGPDHGGDVDGRRRAARARGGHVHVPPAHGRHHHRAHRGQPPVPAVGDRLGPYRGRLRPAGHRRHRGHRADRQPRRHRAGLRAPGPGRGTGGSGTSATTSGSTPGTSARPPSATACGRGRPGRSPSSHPGPITPERLSAGLATLLAPARPPPSSPATSR